MNKDNVTSVIRCALREYEETTAADHDSRSTAFLAGAALALKLAGQFAVTAGAASEAGELLGQMALAFREADQDGSVLSWDGAVWAAL
jgi:hypothetical protein